jgi:hypothetical protein
MSQPVEPFVLLCCEGRRNLSSIMSLSTQPASRAMKPNLRVHETAGQPAQNSGVQQMRPRGRPFQRGISGNPGGRPRELRDVIELARSHSPAAITTLAKIVRDEASARAVLSRFDEKAAHYESRFAKEAAPHV